VMTTTFCDVLMVSLQISRFSYLGHPDRWHLEVLNAV
jgi:hypothetical protein